MIYESTLILYAPFPFSVLNSKTTFSCLSLYICLFFCWQTSSFFLHLFKVQFTEKKIQLGGKQPSGLFLATISLLLSEQVPFTQKDLAV